PALRDVGIATEAEAPVSVVAPTGTSKTTLVNLLTGLLTPTAGDVLFMGESIAGIGPVRLAERGLVRSFQLIQIFPQLTVAETIAAADVSRLGKRWRQSAPACRASCWSSTIWIWSPPIRIGSSHWRRAACWRICRRRSSSPIRA